MAPNRFLTALLAIAALTAPSLLNAAPVLKAGDVIAVCGDSNTQMRRYSRFLEDYLLMCDPVPDLRTIQFGSNGAIASVLGQRIGAIALFHPTAATMFYGVNDSGYSPLDDNRINGFRHNLNYSIDALKGIGVQNVIVASPIFVDWLAKPSQTDMLNGDLAVYNGIAGDVAQQRGLEFAQVYMDMKAMVGKVKAAAGPGAKTPWFDIHPEQGPCLAITHALLKAMGFDGNIATIDFDIATGQAKASNGHKVLSVKDDAVAIESTRYPFCFKGDPDKLGPDTASILKYLPFNEDLNRFMLVVRGVKSTRAKVIWGDQSRVVSSADLEKGVNLAALFVPDNPFSEQFYKVDAAVIEQQNIESTLTWQFLANLARYEQILPGHEALFDQITQAGLAECGRYAKAAAALVIPVRHTIVIEPIVGPVN